MDSKCIVFAVILIISYINGYPLEFKDESYKFYSREDWGAQPSTFSRPLSKPVPYVVIHHTAIPGPCYKLEDCIASMKSMQNYHMSLQWGDIGYNFCVGSEGGVYEGRGWDTMGIHATSANNHSIGISLIGDWRVEVPPQETLDATQALIARGLELGVISTTYKLIGHSQVGATECPGSALLHHISTWPHYSSEPFQVPKSN